MTNTVSNTVPASNTACINFGSLPGDTSFTLPASCLKNVNIIPEKTMGQPLPEKFPENIPGIDENTVNAVDFSGNYITSYTKIGDRIYTGKDIMASIVDVRAIRDEDGMINVIIVDFADRTSEKVAFSKKDPIAEIYFESLQCPPSRFNEELEESVFVCGITICILKKILNDRTFAGTAVYNKVIRKAIKTMKANREAEKRLDAIDREYKERVAKIAAKKRKKKEKRLAAQREEQIQIQAEAYVRAMKMMQCEDCEDCVSD